MQQTKCKRGLISIICMKTQSALWWVFKKQKTNPKKEGDRESNLEITLLFEFTF